MYFKIDSTFLSQRVILFIFFRQAQNHAVKMYKTKYIMRLFLLETYPLKLVEHGFSTRFLCECLLH